MIDTVENTNIPSLRTSILFKVVVLGALILVLLIPISMIGGLVREREARQASVDQEIAQLWGGEQTLIGPLLTLKPSFEMVQAFFPQSKPQSGWQECGDFLVSRKNAQDRIEMVSQHSPCHRLLPKTIEWRGSLRPEVRSRGLFDSVVYEADLTARGTFELPEDLAFFDDGWRMYAIDIGLGELQGLEQISLRLADREVPLRARSDAPSSLQESLGHLFTEELAAGPIEFEIALRLRGSRSLHFVAAGLETTVDLESSWPSPSFVGSTLPLKRKMTEDGFSAAWKIHRLSRPFPAFWQVDRLENEKLTTSSFGLALLLPADQYQQVDRALKYSLLFVITTFGLLLLMEILSPAQLHPMHFLLVGAALVLFYLLLIALSEHLGITVAYGLASIAIVSLLGTYSKAILRSWRAGGIVGGVVAGLYGYLFGLLRAESLALLFGALGLFGLLSMAMYLTRQLNWYTLKFEGQ